MKILVLNCGSSSIKYQFMDTGKDILLAKGLVERIGMNDAIIKQSSLGKDKVKITGEILDHSVAIEYVISLLLDKRYGVIKDKTEIEAVGHRVVHGAETFSGSVLVTDEVMKALYDNIEVAPLHNPPNIMGIEAIRKHLPITPQVAVFDTAFHTTMPDYAFMYGLPYDLYTKYRIRRYGFHGTSHRFVSERAAAYLGRKDLRLVTCHLGNGASIAAIKDGRSLDTSMGFTPLEGLLMGTRCGDVDTSVILFIMSKIGLSIKEATTLINKFSGLQGISGLSSDMREIEEAVSKGDERASLAFNIFCYRIRKYIGAYAAAMNGLDAIVFTGGIGENSDFVRKEVLKDMDYLGISFDQELNKNARNFDECEISTPDSRVRVLKISTNEELVIAQDTEKIVEKYNEEQDRLKYN